MFAGGFYGWGMYLISLLTMGFAVAVTAMKVAREK